MKNRRTNLPNPFISADYFRIKAKQKIIPNKSLNEVVDADGEIHSGVIGFAKMSKPYDSQRFVKAYRDGFKLIANLSGSATKVMLYFIASMNYTDTVEFNIHKCLEFTGYKDRSYIYKAIKELKDNQFLADTDVPKLFFINPTMFYLGQRLRLLELGSE